MSLPASIIAKLNPVPKPPKIYEAHGQDGNTASVAALPAVEFENQIVELTQSQFTSLHGFVSEKLWREVVIYLGRIWSEAPISRLGCVRYFAEFSFFYSIA